MTSRIPATATAAIVAGSLGFGAASAIHAGRADAGPSTDRAVLSELREISRDTGRMESRLSRVHVDLEAVRDRLQGSSPFDPEATRDAGDSLFQIRELAADICRNTRPEGRVGGC